MGNIELGESYIVLRFFIECRKNNFSWNIIQRSIKHIIEAQDK